MIEAHKDVFWNEVEEKKLAERIKWKPLVYGIQSRENYIILKTRGGVSHFVADYLQNKLKKTAKVMEVGNSIFIHFNSRYEKKGRDMIHNLIDLTNPKISEQNKFLCGLHVSFLPKDEKNMEKTLIIEPAPLCDRDEFFSIIHQLTSLYGKELKAFVCHVNFYGKSLDLLRKEFKNEIHKPSHGFIIKSKEVKKFLRILFDLYYSGRITHSEELFIFSGKNFRLEGYPSMFEFQGDLKKAVRFFTGKKRIFDFLLKKREILKTIPFQTIPIKGVK